MQFTPPSSRGRLAAGLFFLLGTYTIPSTASQPAEPPRVELDRERMQVKITVPAEMGRVSWKDIGAALAEARGWTDESLTEILSSAGNASFALDSTVAQLQFRAYNAVLAPHVVFSVGNDDQGRPARLEIQLDREALLSSRRQFSNWFRSRMTRGFSSKRNGLKWDATWRDQPLDEQQWRKILVEVPAVVFVHGLQSRGSSLELLQAGPREAGFPSGTFQYPNDQPIEESAAALAAALKSFASEHPSRKIMLVTHSMGGLVARAAVENPALDPGNVARLIMIAPPNQGSALAYFHFGLDLWEYIGSAEQREQAKLLLGAIEDGLSEASEDLQPDSLFLRKLNQRPRNPRVAYTIVLGDRGLLSLAQQTDMRSLVSRAGDTNRWVRFFGHKADQWLADLDEVIEGKGDGAVAIKRGQLEGVSDVRVLTFGHLNVLDAPQGDIAEVHKIVLERLQAKPTPTGSR